MPGPARQSAPRSALLESRGRHEAAKGILRSGDPAARVRLAARADTPPEVLVFLTGDPVAKVRAAVAFNPAAPAQADRILAADAEPGVRALLARRLAALAPGLAAEAQGRTDRMAWQTLWRLVEDSAEQVRLAIAEAVQAMSDAPRDLVLRLARDTAPPVAEAVIRLSPVLTEQDLLALVTAPPVAETLAAVARRPGLSETLSDALAATGDAAAIAALPDNTTARSAGPRSTA